MQANYRVFPQKLGGETWHLLKSESFARFDRRRKNYEMSPSMGLMMMSLLADACAGPTKRKITDRTEANSWLAKYATAELGGEYVVAIDASQVAPAYERLITISITLLNTDYVPISKHVAMRKREAKSSGSYYRAFRVRYLGKVDEYV